MHFERGIKVPAERLPILIGRKGAIKSKIEREFGVKVSVDSRTCDVLVTTDDPQADLYLATQFIEAIGKGFSPQRSAKLKEEGYALGTLELRKYVKTKDGLSRIKGRLIGSNGIVRKNLEELTGTEISIYGHYAAVIGDVQGLKLALNALEELASGKKHGGVYSKLQKVRSMNKRKGLELWEEQS